MKTYRQHYCGRTHRTFGTLARCIWRRAVWVTGNGPYATVARCRVLTVQLHPTQEAAEAAKRVIDSSGCGGACPCNGNGHDLVRLVAPDEAEPT